MEKWDNNLKPDFVPQKIDVKTSDGKHLQIILNKNLKCFKDWVAEISIGKEKFYMDRDTLVQILNTPTIKSTNAKFF